MVELRMQPKLHIVMSAGTAEELGDPVHMLFILTCCCAVCCAEEEEEAVSFNKHVYLIKQPFT